MQHGVIILAPNHLLFCAGSSIYVCRPFSNEMNMYEVVSAQQQHGNMNVAWKRRQLTNHHHHHHTANSSSSSSMIIEIQKYTHKINITASLHVIFAWMCVVAQCEYHNVYIYRKPVGNEKRRRRRRWIHNTKRLVTGQWKVVIELTRVLRSSERYAYVKFRLLCVLSNT